jgi:hypothetical protein
MTKKTAAEPAQEIIVTDNTNAAPEPEALPAYQDVVLEDGTVLRTFK